MVMSEEAWTRMVGGLGFVLRRRDAWRQGERFCPRAGVNNLMNKTKISPCLNWLKRLEGKEFC